MMAGRAPSWCPWDLGLGPPGDEIALVRVARPPAAPGAAALFQPEPGGWPGAGVWGGNDPDRVPRNLVAVPRLEYPGRVYLNLQHRELESANGRKPEGCSPVFVRVRLEDVGALNE